MTPEQEKTLAAEFVLGLLEGEDLAEAVRRFRADTSFVHEVESWRAHLIAFDDTTEPRPASDLLWQKIEVGMGVRMSGRPSIASAWSRLWSSVPVLRTAALAASFAAVLFAVGLGVAIRQAREQPVMVAVLMDGTRPGAVVHAFADGRVVLVPLISINVPEGRALEVWTLPSRERGPVSVGLMSQARTLQLNLKDLSAPRVDQLFEITLEPASGSPTGRPTGPVLFKGTTSTTL